MMPPSLLRSLLLLPFTALVVEGASSGLVGLCDPRSQLFGCSAWGLTPSGNEDRLQCSMPDSDSRIMAWAASPKRNPSYVLSLEGGGTEYEPGRFYVVELRVGTGGEQFRGLLIDAVDAAGETVGSWDAMSGMEYYYWASPACPSKLLHRNADLKPYRSRLTFEAPQKVGTGTITIRAMMKQGPANHGYFWYPAEDLVLTEAALPEDPPLSGWRLAPAGWACGKFCKSTGEECAFPDGPGMAEGFEGAVLAREFPLTSPMVAAGCSRSSPAEHVADGGDVGRTYVPSGDCGNEKPSCKASSASLRRYCHCVPPQGAGGETRRRLNAEQEEEGRGGGGAFSSSGARGSVGGASSTTALLLSAMLLLSGGGDGGAAALTLLATSALLLASPAAAHNWLGSPSRARGASTFGPCLTRKQSDLHAQVGPGQEVAVKYTTGHGGVVYLTVLRGEDAHWLHAPGLYGMIDDYVANAPAGSNRAMANDCGPNGDVPCKRQRVAREKSTGRLMTTFERNYIEETPIFSRRIHRDDPSYLTNERKPHEDKSFGAVYEYLDSVVAEDQIVSYDSDKYPWIVAAHTYSVVHPRRAKDMDLVRLSLPERASVLPGHYVAQYKWRGYYDCVDIELFSGPVQHKDGRPANKGEEWVWNKVPHCQYQLPQIEALGGMVGPTTKEALELGSSGGEIVTPLRWAVGGDVSVCINDIKERVGNSKFFTRLGVNVAPLRLPAGTLPNAELQYAFKNFTAVDSEVLRIDPTTTTRPPVDWEAWNERTVVSRGYRCKEHKFGGLRKKLTLRQAVLECSFRGCAGIAWRHWGKPDHSSIYSGEHSFMLCRWQKSGKHVVAHKKYTTFIKNEGWFVSAAGEQVPPEEGLDVTVSFQPESSLAPVPPVAGGVEGLSDATRWVADSGRPFKLRKNPADTGHGLAFGWSCDTSQNMRDGSADEIRAAVAEEDVSTTTVWLGNYPTRRHWGQGDLDVCPDGSTRKWEMKVADGIYEVTVLAADRRMSLGCIVEGVQLWDRDVVGKTPERLVRMSQTVSVTDGRITYSTARMRGEQGLRGPHDVQCFNTAWINIRRVARTPDMTPWLPAGGGWMQLELPEDAAPVGLVVLELPGGVTPSDSSKQGVRTFRGTTLGTGNTGVGHDEFNCRDGWLYDGADCIAGSVKMGHVEGDGTGYVLSLSDVPCEGHTCPEDPDARACGSSYQDEAVVCGEPGRANGLERCSPVHDCEGATGRYLRLQLPGDRRIVDVTPKVYRAEPRVPLDQEEGNSDPLLCWGVKPRSAHELPSPSEEYVTSRDPDDPVFYSTCFVREPGYKWLPSPGPAVPDEHPTPWAVNGKCLTCDSHHSGKATTALQAPLWMLEEGMCRDCDNL